MIIQLDYMKFALSLKVSQYSIVYMSARKNPHIEAPFGLKCIIDVEIRAFGIHRKMRSMIYGSLVVLGTFPCIWV